MCLSAIVQTMSVVVRLYCGFKTLNNFQQWFSSSNAMNCKGKSLTCDDFETGSFWVISVIHGVRRWTTAVISCVSPVEMLSNRSVTLFYSTFQNVPKQTTNWLFYCCSDLLTTGFSFCSLYLFMLWVYFNLLYNLCLLLGNRLRSLNPTVSWINNLSILLTVQLIHSTLSFIFNVSISVNLSCIRKTLCSVGTVQVKLFLADQVSAIAPICLVSGFSFWPKPTVSISF